MKPLQFAVLKYSTDQGHLMGRDSLSGSSDKTQSNGWVDLD